MLQQYGEDTREATRRAQAQEIFTNSVHVRDVRGRRDRAAAVPQGCGVAVPWSLSAVGSRDRRVAVPWDGRGDTPIHSTRTSRWWHGSVESVTGREPGADAGPMRGRCGVDVRPRRGRERG